MVTLHDSALWGKAQLRGVGQVMFMRDARSGLLFLAAIAWTAAEASLPQLVPAAVAGTIAAWVAGYLMAPERARTEGADGLWGFNGTLVGCAFATFFEPTALMWISLIIASMLSVPLRALMNSLLGRVGLSSYTAPFVLITWAFLLASREFAALVPLEAEPVSAGVEAVPLLLVSAWLKGVAQVFLLNSAVAGAFILIGLALCSVRAAVLAALASAAASAVALLLGADIWAVTEGLYAYSPVLTAIAVGCFGGFKGPRGELRTLAAVVATVFIQAAINASLAPLGIASLTAAFCVGAWMFVYRPAE